MVSVTYKDKKAELERIFSRELTDREMVEAMCSQQGYYREKLIDAEKTIAADRAKLFEMAVILDTVSRMIQEVTTDIMPIK